MSATSAQQQADVHQDEADDGAHQKGRFKG
jgi:hypothetical protein